MQQIETYVRIAQTWVMYACVGALIALGAALLVRVLYPHVERAWKQWLGLDGFGRIITAVGLVFMTLYGGSKQFFWNRVSNDGADTGTTLVGIYTGSSNDVVTVGTETVTNVIPMVRVAWTGSGSTTNTPVHFRYSDTNEWTTVFKSNLVSGVEGVTNWMEFATLSDYSSFRYWYFGTDTPAIVITTSQIDITSFSEDSTGVSISWMCTDPRATTFDVWTKPTTSSSWTLRTTVSTTSVRLTGFFVGSDTDYKITSTFLEDGE